MTTEEINKEIRKAYKFYKDGNSTKMIQSMDALGLRIFWLYIFDHVGDFYNSNDTITVMHCSHMAKIYDANK